MLVSPPPSRGDHVFFIFYKLGTDMLNKCLLNESLKTASDNLNALHEHEGDSLVLCGLRGQNRGTKATPSPPSPSRWGEPNTTPSTLTDGEAESGQIHR